MLQSARQLLGQSVTTSTIDSESMLGVIETITIDPKTLIVDGLLVGTTHKPTQSFLPRECIQKTNKRSLEAMDHLIAMPKESQRIFNLPAWTTQPKFLVGFVYDVYFSLENGQIESFVVHQLIRTWRIPATSVETITPKFLLIDTDTTIKLKLTPYQA